jgi:hypothetical protein
LKEQLDFVKDDLIPFDRFSAHLEILKVIELATISLTASARTDAGGSETEELGQGDGEMDHTVPGSALDSGDFCESSSDDLGEGDAAHVSLAARIPGEGKSA